MGGEMMTCDSCLPPEVAKAIGSGVPVRTHIPDAIRLGVLAEEEGAELRIEGHIMSCPICGESCLCLWEKMRANNDPPAYVPGPACAPARNALLRYLEDERALPDEVLTHLQDCDGCRTHFIEPAKALNAWVLDEGDSISGQD